VVVLLAALGQTLSAWSEQPTVLLDLEGHGRTGLAPHHDLTRTVGWFTTRYPLTLDVAGASDPVALIGRVKEQYQRVPEQGIGYGLLRYLSADPAVRDQLAALPQPEVSFNYLSHLNQGAIESAVFGRADEAVGMLRGPTNPRRYVLDVDAFIVDGSLEVVWTYSAALHKRETIERLATQFVETLQTFADHDQQPPSAGFTPSDFPTANLSQRDLDTFLRQFAKRTSENTNEPR
jgi:non-ribosomal peptide synthase protein (TIGR01720 family)